MRTLYRLFLPLLAAGSLSAETIEAPAAPPLEGATETEEAVALPLQEIILQQKAEELAGREALIDALEAEVDAALKSRGALLTEREDALTARESVIAAREKGILTREATLQAREELVAGRERAMGAEEASTPLFKPKWPAPSVVGKYAMVIDAATGQVLHSKEGNTKTPVASTQKLLTALLVVEAGDLDGDVLVTREDTQVEPTVIGIKAGETYTRRQLLESLLIRSGNDIAACLARDNAGSIEAFAAKMNARAIQLGMANSNFINPHGLPAEGQHSTAYDMAKVARAAYANEDIREIICQKTATFTFNDGRTRTLVNTNKVLSSLSYCNGMKTGYTRASGNCLISSGEKGGKARIVVVIGSNSTWVWKDSQVLLEWGITSS